MAKFNADIWRAINEKIEEVINAEIAKAIKAHEEKAASDTFANSHVAS